MRKDFVGGRFIWSTPEAPALWVRARAPADELAIRGVDEIAAEELLAAFTLVQAEDPVSEIARYFGVRRVSSVARERIAKAIQHSTSH